MAVVVGVLGLYIAIVLAFAGIGWLMGTISVLKNFICSLWYVYVEGENLHIFNSKESKELYEKMVPFFGTKISNYQNSMRTLRGMKFTVLEELVKKDKDYENHYKKMIAGVSFNAVACSKENPTKLLRVWEDYNYVYEKLTGRSYFLGKCFSNCFKGIGLGFSWLKNDNPDFSDFEFDALIIRIPKFAYCLSKVITMYIEAFFLTIYVFPPLFLITAFCALIYRIFYIFVVGISNIRFKMNNISYRCPNCKKSYTLPVYRCPNEKCNILHKKLRPGMRGMIRRKCVCGNAVLPLNMTVTGYYIDPVTHNKQKIKLRELKNYCPYCPVSESSALNTTLSKPLSVQLIGAASAGKTTFKVAYAYDFLENETLRSDFTFDEWPDENSKKEFDTYEYYYRGTGVLSATQTGMGNGGEDITTFSFRLSHKKMSVDRIIQLYDIPGERFQKGYAKEGFNNLTFSEGSVFLLDPYSLSKVREENKEAVAAAAYTQVDMDKLIDSFIRTLRQLKQLKRQGGKFALPVALSINKADTITLRKQVGKFAVDNLMQMYPDVFRERHVAMDYACRCFLQKNEGGNFIMNLDNNFANVHFFSSSPYGSPNAIGFKPENVMEIMRWLLVRADKEFGNLWLWDSNSGREEIRDLTDEEKKLYLTHREYYENAVEKQT